MPESIEQRDDQLLRSESRLRKCRTYLFWLLIACIGLSIGALISAFWGGYTTGRGDLWMAAAICMSLFCVYSNCSYSLRHIESIKHYQNRLTQTSPE